MLRVLLVALGLLAFAYVVASVLRKRKSIPVLKGSVDQPEKVKVPHQSVSFKKTAGGWLIQVSFFLACASLFFDWADVSFLFWHLKSLTGIALSMTVILTLWLYPLSASITRVPLRFLPWVALSMIATILPLAVWYKIDHTRKFLVIDVDAAFGVMIFAVAGLLLLLGMALHQAHFAIRFFAQKN